MKITRLEIIGQLQTKWPELVDGLPNATNLAIPDINYWMPKKSDVESLVINTFFENYKYKVQVFDCDDFSLVVHAFVVQERYRQIEKREISKEEWFPWSFGQVWGTKFQGKTMKHAINIIMTSDNGIMFLEPQSSDRGVFDGVSLWKTDSLKDNIYFVRM